MLNGVGCFGQYEDKEDIEELILTKTGGQISGNATHIHLY